MVWVFHVVRAFATVRFLVELYPELIREFEPVANTKTVLKKSSLNNLPENVLSQINVRYLKGKSDQEMIDIVTNAG
jgi:hypothetical protein